MTINVGIVGCCGRMGRTLLQCISQHKQMRLSCAVARAGSPFLGQDASVLIGGHTFDVPVQTLEQGIRSCDLLIDFSISENSLPLLAQAQSLKLPLVMGTTGLDPQQKQALVQASSQIPVLSSANFSMGIHLLLKILPQIAACIHDADIEILEAHHRHKIDAPSGTALALGEVISDTLQRSLEENAVYGRHGRTAPRKQQDIGFSSVRAGDIVGEHRVIFASLGECLELTHKASSRATFAQGALRAGSWLVGQKPGFYTMQDVLAM